VITCFTCHRGDTRAVNLPALPPPDPAPLEPPLPSAADVIAKYTAAVGGANESRFGTVVIEGTDVRPEERYGPPVGRSGTFKIVIKGDRFRSDVAVPPDPPSTQVIVGGSGWAARGDAVVPSLPADAVGRVRRNAFRYAPFKVAEPVSALRVERVERIGDRDAYVVAADLEGDVKRSYFFDRSTGLLIREILTTPMKLLPLQEQMEYDDYRSVDGVLLPFRIRFSNDAFYSTASRAVTSIRHDVPIDDAIFDAPVKKP